MISKEPVNQEEQDQQLNLESSTQQETQETSDISLPEILSTRKDSLARHYNLDLESIFEASYTLGRHRERKTSTRVYQSIINEQFLEGKPYDWIVMLDVKVPTSNNALAIIPFYVELRDSRYFVLRHNGYLIDMLDLIHFTNSQKEALLKSAYLPIQESENVVSWAWAIPEEFFQTIEWVVRIVYNKLLKEG